VTEQERKDIENAMQDFKSNIEHIEGDVKQGAWDELSAAMSITSYRIAIRALRRWLDEDREDREHDEA